MDMVQIHIWECINCVLHLLHTSTQLWQPVVPHMFAEHAVHRASHEHMLCASTYVPVTLNKSVRMASVLAEGSNRLATLLL